MIARVELAEALAAPGDAADTAVQEAPEPEPVPEAKAVKFHTASLPDSGRAAHSTGSPAARLRKMAAATLVVGRLYRWIGVEQPAQGPMRQTGQPYRAAAA
ncbi:hypothetical protein ND808_34985 [Streptomyces sp. DR7-3]|uniref:hypothetical protein n=1 Tax=Streptomyces malaysiensis TaxID=92644 RepID=UPI002043ED89|nr:hypothetical protein [Streptomyces sp. DR7-3]MCM3810979.1 hypothetical protein [Streptomyces sp. DR7-3]